MFNGHRGVNHPVKNLITGKCEITSQNHGFVVSRESLASATRVEETHVHLNDNTVAGIRVKGRPVFSVQYHPEASAGPHDSRYLFDEFVDNIAKEKTAVLQ
jgi:carbamoyl-phosphate synthase small subunit